MVYADEILDYSGQRKTGVTAGSYGPASDASPEAGETITVPQLTVNENGLITGAVERTVTLPTGGGGGGGEEQFQKVYETTLTEASDSDKIAITSTDMNGTYVDIVVNVVLPQIYDETQIVAQFFYDEGIVWESATKGSNDSAFGLLSLNGIAAVNNSSNMDIGLGIPPYMEDGSLLYPTEEKPGIDTIVLMIDGEEEVEVLPVGTTITVYARRKVTDNAEA